METRNNWTLSCSNGGVSYTKAFTVSLSGFRGGGSLVVRLPRVRRWGSQCLRCQGRQQAPSWAQCPPTGLALLRKLTRLRTRCQPTTVVPALHGEERGCLLQGLNPKDTVGLGGRGEEGQHRALGCQERSDTEAPQAGLLGGPALRRQDPWVCDFPTGACPGLLSAVSYLTRWQRQVARALFHR